VLVLEAADRISDAEHQLTQAHAARDHTTQKHTVALAVPSFKDRSGSGPAPRCSPCASCPAGTSAPHLAKADA